MKAARRRPAPDPVPAARPTLRDVARRVGGVHPSTVSLALRNCSGVSAALRERIRQAATKLGYRPDPLMEAFNRHRIDASGRHSPPVIALIAEAESRERLQASPLLAGILTGAEETARSLHAKLEVFLCGDQQLDPVRLRRILHARAIPGVILAALPGGRTEFVLEWSELSAVKILGRQLFEPRFELALDPRSSARLAWRNLTDQGYERIGLLGPGDPDLFDPDALAAGVLLEQSRLPAARRVPFLMLPHPDATRVRRWIRRHRIDAVLACAPGTHARLQGQGMTFPEEVAFASLDAGPEPGPCAGMIQDYPQLGRLAVEQVVTLLRSNQPGPPPTGATTLVPARWHAGETAPARPAQN